MSKIRCGWVTADPEYIHYHDTEWGIPQYQRNKLFEMLCLEGQQAGLSWITVLKKRHAYQQAFYDFNPEKIAEITDENLAVLLANPQLIRHRLKLKSIISNARALLAMEQQGECFTDFIWSFVENKPKISHYIDYQLAPVLSPESIQLSKALKKRGFKFVGPIICHAYMQACGLFNDHQTHCFCHPSHQQGEK